MCQDNLIRTPNGKHKGTIQKNPFLKAHLRKANSINGGGILRTKGNRVIRAARGNAKIYDINIINKKGYYVHEISIGSFETKKTDKE